MEDTRYLFRRNRTWCVKVSVPRALRDALGYDLRRSLNTESIDEARKSRDAVVAEFREQIRNARESLEQKRACKDPATADDKNGFPILHREDFSDVTFLLEVEAPLLARERPYPSLNWVCFE